MSKHLAGLFIVIVAFVFAGPSQAKGPKKISVTMDLSERFGPPASQGPNGYLVIDSVTNNRIQPEESGESVTLLPEFADVQIGSIKNNNSEYVILLKDTDIESFVRDVLTLQFNRAGYAVIPDNDARAADAAHVDVDLTALWMWATKLEGSSSRKQFHFQMKSAIASQAQELANLGTVETYGFRNGSRITSWKSYNHTAMFAVKESLDEINNKIRQSAATIENGSESSAASLSAQLDELRDLLDTGVITEEEYAAARAKTLDNFSK
jgi:hypothetical protein